MTFFMMLSIPLHVRRHLQFYKNVVKEKETAAQKHRSFYNDYFAMMDGDAKIYMDTVIRIFKECHLPKGKMTFKGNIINTDAIKKTALMTVEGGKDQFCPPGQTEAAHKICPNIPDAKREQYLQEDVGHYGVFSGSKFAGVIAPKIKAFIQKNASQKETMKSVAKKAAAKTSAASKPKAKAAAAAKTSQSKAKAAAAKTAQKKTKASAETTAETKTKATAEKTVKAGIDAATPKKERNAADIAADKKKKPGSADKAKA